MISFTYNISTISNILVMRIKKKCSVRGLLIDVIPNSPNLHHKNYVSDTKENYQWDLWSWRVFHGITIVAQGKYIVFLLLKGSLSTTKSNSSVWKSKLQACLCTEHSAWGWTESIFLWREESIWYSIARNAQPGNNWGKNALKLQISVSHWTTSH